MSNNIIEILKNTLTVERDTLSDLIVNVNEEMADVVDFLSKLSGRIVMTGVGKSALIGQKIVATMNSTGTKAIFIHAADAIHGDLGAIHNDDAVICISKSGETQELKAFLPHLKNRKIPIIAFVSKRQSFLDNIADHSIYIPVEKEADPNNLAPTASTTAQLAIGDAIAMALQSLNNFTAQHFAENHPGGSLGKFLHTKVVDISSKNNKPQVSLNTPINEIIFVISSSRLGATAVVDEYGMLIGIITDGDLRRMLQNIGYNNDIIAQNIVTKNPKTIEQNELAIEAMHSMHKYAVSQLIVTNQGKYEGIIHFHDLIREGIV